MSPEQAKGKPVDTRTDVWAFGAVLYEMLAGERAFKGEDVSDTLVSVFRDDPDWAKLPGDVPSRVRNAMRVCSKKDAKERVRDIAAVRLALEGAFETEGAPAGAAERPLSRAALLALAFVAGALVVWAMMPETTHDIGVSRTSIVLPQTQLLTATRRMLAVSPTGTHIAYVANLQLYLRAMDEGEAQPLRGTEASNPSVPFFSSNGQWIGFYSLRDGGLRKIAISGGAAVALCSVERPYGASWGSDGTIVFGQPSGEIFRVSADGGDPERIVAVESGSGRAHGPQILPDGRTLLFTLGRDDWNEAQIVVQSMDTGERRILVDGGTDGRYLPSGHLLYGLEGNLLAVPFDAERLEIRGGPVPVIESVMPAKTSGALNFDVSRDGMLAYVAGTADELRTLVWVDRDGGEEPIAAEARAYDQARVSPDGTKALLVCCPGNI